MYNIIDLHTFTNAHIYTSGDMYSRILFILPILLTIPLIGPLPMVHVSRHEVTLRDAKNKPFDADVVVSDASTDMRRAVNHWYGMQCLKPMRNPCSRGFLKFFHFLPPFASSPGHRQLVTLDAETLRGHLMAMYVSLARQLFRLVASSQVLWTRTPRQTVRCQIECWRKNTAISIYVKKICQNTFGKGKIESRNLC